MSRRLLTVFYLVALAVALVGSTAAATHWLGVPWWVAVVPIAAVELGGVVISGHADERRRLGEPAIAARLLAAVVAAGAVTVNVFGHEGTGPSVFFGGFSALAFLVYLLSSGAARRDALRAAGKLEVAAPPYGLWQWLRHPGITRRARILAVSVTPPLGRLASLAAAREQVRAERRQAAISTALRKRIEKAAGPVLADIAVSTYDLDEVAARLAAGADYDGLTGLLSAELTPARLAGADPAEPPPAVTEADTTGSAVTAPVRPARRPVWRPTVRRSGRLRRTPPVVHVTVESPAHAPVSADNAAGAVSGQKRAVGRTDTAALVSALAARKPDVPPADVARLLGVTERTVRRYMPARINGTPVVSGARKES